MAVVDPVLNTGITGVPRVIWEGAAAGDTFSGFIVGRQYGLAASIQAVGTFGGATIGLQVSNNGDNWAAAKDTAGNAVSLTAATGYHELSLSGAYIRPSLTGGSGGDIDIIVVLRGS